MWEVIRMPLEIRPLMWTSGIIPTAKRKESLISIIFVMSVGFRVRMLTR